MKSVGSMLHISSYLFGLLLAFHDVKGWSTNQFHPRATSRKKSERASPLSVSLGGGGDEELMFSTGPIVTIAALVIGISAQTWINSLLKGERGLSAYLRDGGGFAGSGFSKEASEQDALSGEDPLPWLKLPKLDFVEVSGQEERRVELKMEQVRIKMNKALEQGEIEQAKELRSELEIFMKENGFKYNPDETG
mmetsp:Transcript_11235/g.12869  ORF Transcript_11235/g.12869 Transcript_11235/m.12869 type:complete len:193 (-) Transcript_11235:381-959(-)|eukprot:CAMPEP_0194178922 /NCGR_PEP_ID=MMETSP0154-20130528/12455_1 /TAXON_ID=1049557 /ORGANISM="Thalassiothrix antarctica, Strain L6-D1" /LENGTH=192 /DNA_ID=CAMNT_0038894073 /DNA_START=19 /DNA_END=597 /DNA_ORIENTATION=-